MQALSGAGRERGERVEPGRVGMGGRHHQGSPLFTLLNFIDECGTSRELPAN